MPASTEAVNARLRGVRETTGTDSYETGAAAGGGPVRWAGNAGCWYEERRDKRRGPEGSDVEVWRELVVSADLRIAFDNGDTVTFEHEGATRTGHVDAIELFTPPPGQAGEIRLTLTLT